MPNAQGNQPERKYIIRLARTGDIPQVIELDTEITGIEKPEYWSDIFERYSCRASDESGDPNSKSARRNRFFLVAADGDSVLGFIIGEIRAWEFGSPPCGWVFAIGIRRDVRQFGVGNALFEAVCDRFRKAGVGQVRTMLARDDKLVMSFFRSQGMMAGRFIELEKDL